MWILGIWREFSWVEKFDGNTSTGIFTTVNFRQYTGQYIESEYQTFEISIKFVSDFESINEW